MGGATEATATAAAEMVTELRSPEHGSEPCHTGGKVRAGARFWVPAYPRSRPPQEPPGANGPPRRAQERSGHREAPGTWPGAPPTVTRHDSVTVGSWRADYDDGRSACDEDLV